MSQLIDSGVGWACENLQTIGNWIEAIESAMTEDDIGLGQGTLDPYDEARWLALGALGLAVDSDGEIESRVLSELERGQLFAAAVERVQLRIPTAYILKETWLLGYRFRADARAIIPRSLLAELIVSPESMDGSPPPCAKILDLCCGSASLAIIAAHRFPNCKVTAVDISPEALSLALENVTDHGLKDRVRLIESDLFAGLSLSDLGRFDLILCNPPYVPVDKHEAMPAEFQREPRLALAAGADGMEVVARVLGDFRRWLAPGGRLLLEVGHEGDATDDLLDLEFPYLTPIWLDTSQTSHQVFMLKGAP